MGNNYCSKIFRQSKAKRLAFGTGVFYKKLSYYKKFIIKGVFYEI